MYTLLNRKTVKKKTLIGPHAGMIGGICLAVFLPFASTVSAKGQVDGACLTAIKKYGVPQGVPFNVLYGIASVESNFKPWALNVSGKSIFLKNREQTVQKVSRLLKDGKRSFDVGCMQMNVKWHHQRFKTVGQLVDPNHNVYQAARFLIELYREKKSWPKAVAAYHSRTPSKGKKYLQAVSSNLIRRGAK